MIGIDNIRNMLNKDSCILNTQTEVDTSSYQPLENYLYQSQKRVIFTMGKGGVGKTTIAVQIARGLASKGVKVHLSTSILPTT